MRETSLTICTGLMGVGKSFTTEKLVREYQKAHPKRPILVFDPNFEDTWNKNTPVAWDIIELLQAKKKEAKDGVRILTSSEKNISKLPGGIYTILPFTKFKEKMNIAQQKATMISILSNFRGGLVLLEDVNKYISTFQKDEILGSFKAIRHNDIDVIVHMQSAKPLRPILLESVTRFRMHYDGQSLATMKTRLGDDYEIMRIGQIAVNRRFIAAQMLKRQNRNWENDAKLKEQIKQGERFYLWVFTKQRYITGITSSEFVHACSKYLNENTSEIKPYMQKGVSLSQAKQKWIVEHLHYFKE